MQTMGNEGRLAQGVTLQKMGNEARKTHCSHKELQCKQWVMKEDLHKELHCKKMGIEARKTHCSYKV
ncbi:hypothetical protein KSS87_020451 [Heliosperma pusillum]|nr:hypothetical protein KSS87_020451 [Heliosperma pusillum]